MSLISSELSQTIKEIEKKRAEIVSLEREKMSYIKEAIIYLARRTTKENLDRALTIFNESITYYNLTLKWNQPNLIVRMFNVKGDQELLEDYQNLVKLFLIHFLRMEGFKFVSQYLDQISGNNPENYYINLEECEKYCQNQLDLLESVE